MIRQYMAAAAIYGLLTASVVVVPAAFAQPSAPPTERRAQPKVLAIVVGVTKYQDQPDKDPILICAQNAKEVAAAVRKTFLGANVHILQSDALEPQLKPTYSNLRRLLNDEIPKLPQHSYVIFYFAGHGIRVGDPGKVGSTELGLVLEGGKPTSQNPDYDNIILYSELLAPFKRMKLGNFLLLLDCCYAGLERNPCDQRLRTQNAELTWCGNLSFNPVSEDHRRCIYACLDRVLEQS